MRRRLTMLWTLAVLGLALMLPVTTLGAVAYKATVLWDVCTLSGGANGYGYAEMTVQARENGKSGTNYFVIKTKLQEGYSSTGPWYTEYTWQNEYSSWFANTRANHYRDVYRYYDFDSSSTTLWHRLVFKVQFWSDWGLITTRTVKGTPC